MKKIITIFTLCVLFSCSEENNSGTSSDADAIALLKIEDKSNFTDKQFRTMVDYLDKHPQKQIPGEVRRSSKISGSLTNTAVTGKSQIAAAEPNLGEYMAVYPYTSPADDYASVDLTRQGSFYDLVYKWTVGENALGFYRIMSREYVRAQDGQRDATGQIWTIMLVSHAGSYLEGIYGPLSWLEHSHANTPGLYGAFFITSGQVQALGASRQISSSRYANISTIVRTGGYYSGTY